MTYVDPVDFDIRLIRQRMRRQELKDEDYKKHQKSLEDAQSNCALVDLEVVSEPQAVPPMTNGVQH